MGKQQIESSQILQEGVTVNQADKKVYSAPILTEWGSLRDMTKGGGPGAIIDITSFNVSNPAL